MAKTNSLIFFLLLTTTLEISHSYYLEYDIEDLLHALNSRHKREASEPTTTESPSDSNQDPSSEGDTTPTDNQSGDTTYSDQSPSEVTHDHYNPLIMSRPGEAPPVFMRQTAGQNYEGHQGQPSDVHGSSESLEMPQALPLLRNPFEQPSQDSKSGDSLPSDHQGEASPTDHQGDSSHGNQQSGDSTADAPVALPLVQARETPTSDTGDAPVAMMQRQAPAGRQASTTRGPPQRPASGRGQGQDQGRRSRGPPPSRSDRQPPSLRNPFERSQRGGELGRDALATAAILGGTDVADTMQDSMEFMARRQALDSLTGSRSRSQNWRGDWGQPSGRRDSNSTQGRSAPAWDRGRGSAPQRSGPSSALDTLSQVHAMDAHADIVDTARDVHQDAYDYRRDYYDRRYGPWYDPRYDPYWSRSQGTDRRFPSDQNFNQESGGSNRPRYPPGDYPYPPYYQQGDRDRYQSGYNLDINLGQFPPCTNRSDPACLQRLQAQRAGMEMDIETPTGEADIEPDELDLEGTAAADLLRTLGIAKVPGTAAVHQEISINHHVLEALRQKFGVNTTNDIKRMSSDPQFRSFMYQVLMQSSPVAAGEYSANLTRAAVQKILANLDPMKPNQAHSPEATHLLTNLDNAQLNQNLTPNGTSSSTNPKGTEAVLTIDGPPKSPFPGTVAGGNLWATMGAVSTATGGSPPSLLQTLLGTHAGVASPLVQSPDAAGAAGTGTAEGAEGIAQPGIISALVSHLGSGEPGEASENQNQTAGGEPGEKAEPKEQPESKPGAKKSSGNSTVTPTAGNVNSTVTPTAGNVNSTTAGAKNTTSTNGQSGTSTTAVGQEGEPVAAKQTDPGEAAEVRKDGKANVKDGQSQQSGEPGVESGPGTTAGAGSSAAAAAGSGASGVKSGADGAKQGGNSADALGKTGTGAGTGKNPSVNGAVGTGQGKLLEPNSQTPVELKPTYNPSKAAFGIVAAVLIGLIIIVGPILCLLCRLRERRAKQKRKEKALKNRDISANNITEAMVLNDLGHEEPMLVANEAEAALRSQDMDREYTDLDLSGDTSEFRKYPYMSGSGHLP